MQPVRRETSWQAEARAEPRGIYRSWMSGEKGQGVRLEHQQGQRRRGCSECAYMKGKKGSSLGEA